MTALRFAPGAAGDAAKPSLLRFAPGAEGDAAKPSVIGAIEVLRQSEPGCYDDELVSVRRGGPSGMLVASMLADGRLGIRHGLMCGELDDGLAERLEVELAPLTGAHEVFTRAFTGVVITSAADPVSAWNAFYRNSLATLIDRRVAGYPEVYRHAVGLLPTTSVLDLGCGFGFLSLHLAALGAEVFAADIEAGTLDLLRLMSDRLQRRVSVLDTNGECVPLLARSVDAVVMLHVLEHVTDQDGAVVIAEAMRVARRRVVIAVPFEDRPTSLYGHLRCFGPDDLLRLGAASGWSYDVHEHHGGWLVLDRPSSGRTDHPSG